MTNAAGIRAVGDQFPVAVQVGEDRLEQSRALRRARRDPVPFVLGDQQRDGRDRPGPLVAVAGDAETGADILGVALDALAGMAEIFAGGDRELLERRGPRSGIAARDDIARPGAAAIIG